MHRQPAVAPNLMLLRATILTLASLATVAGHASGVSPYLPLSQAPEIERMIERVLILADKSVLTRPIAAATVYDALPADLGSDLLLAVRAVDCRYRLSERLSVGGFLGAARLDLATPAYGYYFGAGIQFRDLMPSWDLGIDLRYGDKVARDNLLPTDPQGGSPDNFYDIGGVSLYFSRRF